MNRLPDFDGYQKMMIFTGTGIEHALYLKKPIPLSEFRGVMDQFQAILCGWVEE